MAPAPQRRWARIPPRELIRRRFFPDVVLRTHDGRKVRFYSDLIKDRIVTINFMYAGCTGVCVPTTANLLQVQTLLGRRVGRDVFMYSLTLKPEVDTPQVLRAHARMHGCKPGWTFLTGAAEDLELLRQKLGFTSPNAAEDLDKANHVGMVRVGNERLQLWMACPGTARPAAIARAIAWVDGPRGRPKRNEG
jgi:protein SCO1/2